ncbi:MAG: hypothetical protein Q3X49_03700 [Slackia sp.]|uniref:hypothetical protein n=1 Tax=Slackia sp. TaxID=2049041 RepID=UPI0028492B62|nr:hypothetical protein [Slackia sp.]MDR3900184.1 hypothetical protein [Slackia sp.]
MATVDQIRECTDCARAFLYTANKVNSIDDFALGRIYPCVVNAAFSCELFEKAIVATEAPDRHFSNGHRLKDLFSMISPTGQAFIQDAYSRANDDIETFDQLLDEANEAFIEWRYAYEKNVDIHPNALIAFAEALNNYLKTIEE